MSTHAVTTIVDAMSVMMPGARPNHASVPPALAAATAGDANGSTQHTPQATAPAAAVRGATAAALLVLAVPRQGRSSSIAVIGVRSLVAFAWMLTRVDVAFAGRAYAAYGGIYIAASLGWLWIVEVSARQGLI